MKIELIAVGQKMPDWVNAGFEEFAQRLPREVQLQLREIAPGKRGKNADIRRIVADEGDRILEAIGRDTHVVALEVTGQSWTTEKLAERLEHWMHSGQPIALLVGGPDGLADACRQRASEQWSLSSLTFPHPLVRIIIAEQVYRAWSIINNHPYHRA